jgi:hypothetical protein
VRTDSASFTFSRQIIVYVCVISTARASVTFWRSEPPAYNLNLLDLTMTYEHELAENVNDALAVDHAQK